MPPSDPSNLFKSLPGGMKHPQAAENLRRHFRILALLVGSTCPEGQEKSQALEDLEFAFSYAVASLENA